ncbi:hypothetical protein PFBG_06290, partial [Plasmodium falciparum 7G8]
LQKDGQDVGKDDKLKGAGGLCILEKTNSEENGKKQKTFNNFFNFWVAHVLKDSIEWREKLGKCLENGTKTCKNKQCRKNCECYESWIQQKEDEWKLIEQHYEKEDFHDWDPYWALEYNLQDDYFPSIQKAYPRVKFVEEIEQIIDENKANISNCTKDNNSITKLLKKEEVIATNCLQKCQETQKPPAGGDAGGRSLTPAGGATDSGGGHSSEDVEDEEDDDDDDDEDGDENEEDEDKDEVAVEGEDTDGESGPKVVEPEVTKVDGVKPACDIVAELFEKPKDFKEVACKQKYGLPQRYWGWKCIPSGDNSTTREGSESAGRSRRDTGSSGKPTSDKGSICVPPRRRRLYVKKLHNWATALPQGEGAASTETPQVALLRDAFIQSAAIETFFLWDRYKKIKEKERQEKEKREREERALLLPFASQASGIQVLDQNRVAPQLPPSLPASLGQAQPTPLTQQPVASSDGDPPTSLQKGHIPPDFLRQMFYTLADYRDILVRGGGNNTNISGSSDKDRPSSNNNNIVLLASENRGEMEKIQEQLKVFFSNSGNQSSTGGRNPLQNGDTSPQNSDKRQTLWQNIAKDIWNAMVCALTYKDNTNGGPPTQDEEVKKALLDNDGKPQNSDYTYDKVELKDNDENGGPSPKPQSTSTSGDNTPLTQFVERPPYFRYLEEWGETFCRQRTRMLKNVKKACREKHDGGDTFCSGDGHDCTDVERRYNNMFADINCRDCYEQCRKYRKWIDMKFEEFQKQKDKYKGELDKLTKDKSGGGDNNCCKEIKNHSSAADFLKSLRHCKDDEVHEEKGDEYQKNKIDFKNITQTFSPSTYCKVCPLYGVNCNANKRGKSGTNGCTTNTEPTNQKSAEGVATPITILINDGATDGSTDVTDKQLEEKCKEYGLYKDLRKQEWNCEHNNNIYKCELQKPLNSEYYDDKIPFNILFQRWLIDFIQYYNKSKERITRCTNNVTSCKEGCNNKCNCVKKWLEKKEQEWNIIKKYYKERLQSDDERIASRIKSFFEQGTFPSDVTKAKKVVKCKDEQDKLWGCTGETECKNEQEEKEHADFITNLISKLKEKISECTSQPSDKTQANCGEYTPPDDEDLLLEEEYPENTLEQPKFCPTPTQPPEEKGGETCGNKEEKKDEKKEESEEDGVPAAETPDTGPPAPKQPQRPRRPRRTLELLDNPPLKTALVTSTLAWSVGIAFTALSYWLLKKKTKRLVDLFSVIDIPKGEYGMPILKSSNRYIPYASGKYKGKTYLYVEGDSSGDEKYAFMSDTTDITSSESEYEEIDINDIYVPSTPKYKTLIEVVLEPSGKTQSGNNIPSGDINSGDHIPSDNTPTPSPINDDEWNELKHDFISNMLQNIQPNDYRSGNIPLNTHPTTSRHNMEEKPFIMSIHDRNLLNGEEYSYDMSTNSGNNDLYSGNNDLYSGNNDLYSGNNDLYSGKNNLYSDVDSTSDNRGPTSDTKDPISDKNGPYSGIDLINDSLSFDYDIYDEILKRKENELFGTNHHTKHTSTHNVAKNTNSDPITNQLEMFHKWLDRHRNMCQQWDNTVDILNKLKEEWDSDKLHTPIDDIPSDNKTLNTDVSIQIHMDNPKPTNEDNVVDCNPVENNIYVDSNPDRTFPSNPNLVENNTYVNTPTNVQIEMDVNNHKVVKEIYPISDMWDI